MRNYDNWPTPERMAEIEAQAEKALKEDPSEWDDLPPLEEGEQPEPPDTGAPPPVDDTDATTIGDLRIHPAADIFPRMSESEFEKHRANVKENGQLVPILVSPDGLIIDGRARARACHELGIEPRTEVRDGDPLKIVIAANRFRQHMTSAILAWSGLGLTQPQNPDQNPERAHARGIIEPLQNDTSGFEHEWGKSPLHESRWRKPVMTQLAAAAEIGIHVDQIRTALAVQKVALPGIVAAILDGRIKTINHAFSIVTPDRDEKRDGLTSEQKQKLWLKDPRNLQFKARRKPAGPTIPITAGAIKALTDAERFALMDKLAPGANRYGAVEGWKWQRVRVVTS